MRLGLGLGIDARGGPLPLARFGFATAPISSGVFVLPAWLAIACATAGRTSQTSAISLRTGFSANAARARSVDGVNWGLSVESARTNLVKASNDITAAFWNFGGNTGVTRITAAHLDPAGGSQASTATYDGSGAAGSYKYGGVALDVGAVPNSTNYTQSMWAALVSGGAGIRSTMNLAGFSSATLAALFQRFSLTETTSADASGQQLQFTTYAPAGVNAPFVWAVYGHQIEASLYPSSIIPTGGATGTRAADVLSIPSPPVVAPGGFFDLTLTVAPNYATAEQAVDHTLLHFGVNDLVFLRASDHKVVLRIGGADVASSALTWSRDQGLTIRARHGRDGRTLTVAGATTGNGTATAGAVAAITLPGTAYLLGDSSGAQECADLRSVRFAA